jgi:hypothetical protein
MKKFNKKSGQGTLEWILILAVMVGFVMIFGKTIKQRIGTTTDTVFKSVDSSVTTLSDPNQK